MRPQTYNCLVVDDEPIARKIILGYIRQMPSLQLAGECIRALDALDFLRSGAAVDIIFLDINMPNLSGLQLLKILRPRQPVIFTTAYAEFAVESYELNALDYLLKPFSFERFTKAVLKAINVLEGYRKAPSHPGGEARQLFIKSDGKVHPVFINDILYCEAMKNYTMVMLNDGRKLMPLTPLSKFDAILSDAGGDFIQIHRSFLVSRKHIRAVSAGHVTVSGFELPLGLQFRERFHKAIGMRQDGAADPSRET